MSPELFLYVSRESIVACADHFTDVFVCENAARGYGVVATL